MQQLILSNQYRFFRVFTPKSLVRNILIIQSNSYVHRELRMKLSIWLSRIIRFPSGIPSPRWYLLLNILMKALPPEIRPNGNHILISIFQKEKALRTSREQMNYEKRNFYCKYKIKVITDLNQGYPLAMRGLATHSIQGKQNIKVRHYKYWDEIWSSITSIHENLPLTKALVFLTLQ